jgi:hypothetical protein
MNEDLANHKENVYRTRHVKISHKSDPHSNKEGFKINKINSPTASMLTSTCDCKPQRCL